VFDKMPSDIPDSPSFHKFERVTVVAYR